ncbi:hypothetical protein SLA2020_305260 [Shorea laevis]
MPKEGRDRSIDRGNFEGMGRGQFRKSSGENSSATPPGDGTQLAYENSLISMTPESTITDFQEERREEGPTNMSTIPFEDHIKPNLLCPLCRGLIKDRIVVEPARQFMNTKSRSCSCETCDRSDTYADLRKHARLEHPSARPSETDPERQFDWRRLERLRDLGHLLSTLRSSFGDEKNDDSILPIYDGGWLTVYFLSRVCEGDPPEFGKRAMMGKLDLLLEMRIMSPLMAWRRRVRRRTTADEQQ